MKKAPEDALFAATVAGGSAPKKMASFLLEKSQEWIFVSEKKSHHQ